MKKHYRKENDCLNCGAILQGHYCHICGQENLELHESFGHMMNHAISDYFHFDHQFFHTLKPLLFKPGFLTNEYMAGRRAQYLHPVKMYIFVSIVYFLFLFQSSGESNIVRYDENAKPAKNGIVIKSADDKELDSAKKLIAANSFIPTAAKKKIEENINRQKKVGKNENTVVTNYKKKPNGWFHPNTKDSTYAEYLANQKKLTSEEQDSFFERIWNKKTFQYREEYGDRAKEVFLDELKHNAPKMMFLLLPLFALILKIAFWKNKKFYVEHLIYSFHFHCFLFLFLAILMLLHLLIPVNVVWQWVTLFAMLYVIWYIYRSFRMVYHRNIFRTITKIFGIYLMYITAFTFCIILLFIVTTII
jgi:hypothetical protein